MPDLIEVGTKPAPYARGRFFPGFDVPFIASPLDIASLPHVLSPRWVSEYVLIPSAAILDLASFMGEHALDDFNIGTAPCNEGSVHPALDARFAWLPVRPGNQLLAVARKRVDADGRLQRTRASAADFVFGPRTPGRVP